MPKCSLYPTSGDRFEESCNYDSESSPAPDGHHVAAICHHVVNHLRLGGCHAPFVDSKYTIPGWMIGCSDNVLCNGCACEYNMGQHSQILSSSRSIF